MRRFTGKLERKSGSLEDCRLDNLTSTVNDLFMKAVKNEQIFRHYQQFELKLLDQGGLESLLDLLLNNTLDYFQLDCVELYLYDPQDTLAELLSEEYLILPELHLLSSTVLMDRLYPKHPAVRLVSLEQGKSLPVFADKQLRSAALLPLVRQGVLVGSLHFGTSGAQRFTLDKSTDFIAHLASIVSVCLENAVNQERLNRLSMYDALTKVKNRRAFHLALTKEVSRTARSADPLSLIFIDLDHFKQINDNYGHPIGDKVLRKVAQAFNEILRKTDHVCRYGGEEFALILPSCSQQRAMEIAERIRQQISELVVENEVSDKAAAQLVSVTLSLGVCCWTPGIELYKGDEADLAARLVTQSDRGVYQSKAAGRNCVHYVGINDDPV